MDKRYEDIVLMKEELLQAIRVEGDLLGDSVEVLAGAADTGTMAAVQGKANTLRDIVDDEVKRAKVMRVIDLAVNEYADMLFPYSKEVEKHPSAVVANMYKEPEMWQVAMMVPVTMARSTCNYLGVLAQEYVVARVVEDWCGRFMPERVEAAAANVEALKRKVEAAKDKRVAPVRRRSSVY